MVEKSIGKRIQEFRKRKGLTQDDLAEMIDISPNYLSALERGVYNISIDLLIKIMNCLDCTANDLFCDVMHSGYEIKASRLSDMIENLPPKEQSRIFSVVEAMVKTYLKQ
ncbi:MAG: helix-turn-helix transcriptional regulator [Clostridiales bacterium]|nr:helix-turn-helix transcriptional regulator [Clostridiales bacterium]